MADNPPAEDHETIEGRPPFDPAADGPSAERFGPISLTRHRKDDGRALILYRAGPDGEGAP